MNLSAVVHFAQNLASNQPKVREKTLKKVGLWLERKSVTADGLDEETLLKMWKGLFYYFWHCDKMLVQEDRADIISKYVLCFKRIEFSFLYVDTFFHTMTKEWHGIDRYRIEKFLMLIRRMLHQSFQLLKNKKWNVKCINNFIKVLQKTVLSPANTVPYGLKIHISDIYLEELAKVGSDELSPKQVRKFLLPYCEILCYCDDPSFRSCVKKDIFLYLINQDADAETFHDFPFLKFKPVAIQKLLLKYANMPDVTRKNMKIIHNIVKEFEDYKNGVTLGDKLFNDQTGKRKIRKRTIEKASLALMAEEAEYFEEKKAFRRSKAKKDVEESVDELEQF